jgi:hypothetical protein
MSKVVVLQILNFSGVKDGLIPNRNEKERLLKLHATLSRDHSYPPSISLVKKKTREGRCAQTASVSILLRRDK